MRNHWLEPRVVLRVAVYQPREPVSLYQVHGSCFAHVVSYLLQQLELCLLNFKREVVVVNDCKDSHEEVSVAHNPLDDIIDHWIKRLQSESLDFFAVFRCQHLAIVCNETLVKGNTYLVS